MRFGRCLGFAALSWIVISANIYGQVPDVRIRKVPRSPGKPVSEMTRPNEDAILLEDTTSPPLEVIPAPGVSTIEWKSHIADAVVLAEVQSAEPKMTPSQDWVVSTVTGSIIDILKTPLGWNGRPGDRVSFDWDGGDLLVGGTRVIAVVPWARPIEAGKRYLMFLKIDPTTNRIVVGPTATYEMVDSIGFRRLAKSLRDQEDIEKLLPDEVFVQIRVAVATPR